MQFRKYLAVLTAVIGFGLFGFGTANAATVTTPETTTFSYAPNSAILTVAPSGVVPPRGTAVSFDLEFAVSNAMPANASPAAIAAEVTAVITALEASPFNIPAADFANAPVGGVLPPAGTATTVTLYSVGTTKTSFEVSGAKNGVPITIPASVTVGGSAETVVAGSGQVTWNLLTSVKTVRPHVYGGHIVTVTSNSAVVGWSEGPGVSCELVKIWGYGFSAADGSPHVGYTCDTGHAGTNEGYLDDLAAGHGYDLEIVPATNTARALAQPLPDAQVGWIYLVTTK